MRLIRSFTAHSLQALAEAALISALIIGLIAVPALAGKGGGGGNRGGGGNGGTLAGPVMVNDADGDGAVSYMDDVTFDVSTTATDRPMVGMRCWQAENWMYDGYVGYWPEYRWEQFFRLGSENWNPSATADCTARLFYYNKRGGEVSLAPPVSFTVAP